MHGVLWMLERELGDNITYYLPTTRTDMTTATREQVRSYLETIYQIAGGNKKVFLERIEQVKNDLGFDAEHEEVKWVLENWSFEE